MIQPSQPVLICGVGGNKNYSEEITKGQPVTKYFFHLYVLFSELFINCNGYPQMKKSECMNLQSSAYSTVWHPSQWLYIIIFWLSFMGAGLNLFCLRVPLILLIIENLQELLFRWVLPINRYSIKVRILKYFFNILICCPDWYGSLDWGSTCEREGLQFDPSQGTCLGCGPGPHKGYARGSPTSDVSLPLSLLPSL